MIRSRKFDSCPCIQIRRDVTLKKYLVPVFSLVLVFSLSVGVVANAAFPSSESLYVDTSQRLYFRTGSTDIGSAVMTDMGATALSYSATLSGLNRTAPSSLTTSFWLKGNQYFPGGRTYNIYAEGDIKAVGESYTYLTAGHYYRAIDYPSITDGTNTATYVSASQTGITYSWNGQNVTVGLGPYSGADLYWGVNSSNQLILKRNTSTTTQSNKFSKTPYFLPANTADYPYNTLNSIELMFSNVSGADPYIFTAPAGTFSCYNGTWKMNLAISLPYGFDYDSYINIKFNFSSPTATGNINSLYFSFEDLSYTDVGQFDESAGALADINANMQSAANSLLDIAAQLQGMATEYTLGQCLTAVNNIYQYLSGNIYPLLNSMNSTISGIYGYMTGTMHGTLTSILTQIGNVVTAVNKAGSDIVAALEAQTAALIAYFESVFSKAGEDLGQTNEDLNQSITDFNGQEDELTGDFNASWSSFDFESYEVDASLGNAFTWVSGRFMDLWNALGADVQLLITIPCVIGLGMMVVTGSSRYFGRASIGKEDDD